MSWSRMVSESRRRRRRLGRGGAPLRRVPLGDLASVLDVEEEVVAVGFQSGKVSGIVISNGKRKHLIEKMQL